MKKIIGGVITLAIGGMVFNVNQANLVNNFSKETGLSQTEAQQYVEKATNEGLSSFDVVGAEFIDDGKLVLEGASEIDCVNNQYSWETRTLSCAAAKAQLNTLGNGEIALGVAYNALSLDTATKKDMSTVVELIDRNNAHLNFEIVSHILDPETIEEIRKTNSFNKALLISALESDN